MSGATRATRSAEPVDIGSVRGKHGLSVAMRAHHLGPAEVLSVTGPSTLSVRREDGEVVEAMLATAVAYRAEPGDEVLLIGDAATESARHWVIGVIDGRGVARLEFQGDVEIRSVTGSVRIGADKAVEIDAPRVSLRSEAMRVVARTATQLFDSLEQAVTDLLAVRARRQTTSVDETSHTQAGSATIVTREDVTINGRRVHLG